MKDLTRNSKNDFITMRTLFDNFFNNFEEAERNQDNIRLPEVDLIENEKNYVIKANLPGIKKENISISINNNELILEAKQEEKKEEKTDSLYKCERYSGSYKRVFGLTKLCDIDKIEADSKEGVLTIKIPKKKPAPVKQISVK